MLDQLLANLRGGPALFTVCQLHHQSEGCLEGVCQVPQCLTRTYKALFQDPEQSVHLLDKRLDLRWDGFRQLANFPLFQTGDILTHALQLAKTQADNELLDGNEEHQDTE